MMIIDNKYEIGDVVYLATDEYQLPRVVTAITVRGPLVTYELTCGSSIPTWHLDAEITLTKDVMKSLLF